MALEFKVYERGQSAELENLGTVKKVAGKGGKTAFIPKNFKNDTKPNGEYNRVAVIIKKKDGSSVMVSCSEPVSRGLRSGTITEENLMALPILENEDGIAFISLDGGALVELDVDSITAKAMTATAVSFEELVGL